MSYQKSKIFSQLFRVILYLFAVFAVTELLCRVFSPEYRRDLYYFDLSGVIRHKSNYSGKIYSDKNLNGWMWVDTDSLGLRTSLKKEGVLEEPKFKVLLLGDSLSFGQHLNIENTFSFGLERALSNILGERVEIRNCSIVAANLSELYLSGAQHCDFSDVDLTIVQPTIYEGPSPFALFYGENLGSDFQLIAFLHQCLPEKNLKQRLTVGSYGDLKFQDTNNFYRKIYAQYFGPWMPFYRVSHFARKIEHNYILRIKFSCRKLKFPILYTPEALDVYKSILTRYNLGRPDIPSAHLALGMLQKWSDERKGKLLVLGLPNARGLNISSNRINGSKRQFVTKVFRARSSQQLIFHRNLYNNFSNVLQKKGIHFIDLVEPLSSFETDELFLEGDIHLNDFGHKKVAELIADYIVKNNMFN